MKFRYFTENIERNLKKNGQIGLFVIASIYFIWTHLFPYMYAQIQTHMYKWYLKIIYTWIDELLG